MLHDHTTHVGHDHRNTVDNNDTELVKGSQELTVEKNRTKEVAQDEKIEVRGNRASTIGSDGGHDTLVVVNNQDIHVGGNRTTKIAFGNSIHVGGIQNVTIAGSSHLTIGQGLSQQISSGGWTMFTTGNVAHGVDGNRQVDTTGTTTLQAQQDFTIAGQNVFLRAADGIRYLAPGGFKSMTPAAKHDTETNWVHTVQQVLEHIGVKFSINSRLWPCITPRLAIPD